MNDLQIFHHDQFGQVRVQMDERGEPWWIAADVCRVLDLNNVTEALRGLDDDEKMTLSNPEGHSGARGGARIFNMINEPGLYALVGRSRKPEAKAFDRWVRHEVLPSIRKHSGYLTPAKIEEVLSDPDTIIRLATDLKTERAKVAERDLLIERQAERIEADLPKVALAEAIVAGEGDIEVGELAVIVGMARNKEVFRLLRDGGWLIKQPGGRVNQPTRKAMGLIREIERPRVDRYGNPVYGPGGKQEIDKVPMITPAGQEYFVNLFKKSKPTLTLLS